MTVSRALNLDFDGKYLQFLIQCVVQGTMELIIATNIILLSQFEYTTNIRSNGYTTNYFFF